MAKPTSVQFILGNCFVPGQYSYDLEFFPGESYSRHHYLTKPGDFFYETASRNSSTGDINVHIRLKKNGAQIGGVAHMIFENPNIGFPYIWFNVDGNTYTKERFDDTNRYDGDPRYYHNENINAYTLPFGYRNMDPNSEVMIYVERFTDGCPNGDTICTEFAKRWNITFNAFQVSSPEPYNS